MIYEIPFIFPFVQIWFCTSLLKNETITDDKKVKRITFTNLLKVAAIAILVVLSGLYVTDQIIDDSKPVLAKKNTEFVEAQNYYIQQVDHKMNQIQGLETNMSDEQKEMLVKEMTEMDVLYKKLKEDYKDMPNDPRIVQALLQHYQMKMEVLNRIINDLNNVQQFNTPNHEDIEI